METNIPDWFKRIPKVELHLHLEGSIPLPTLWQLIQKYGGDAEAPTIESLTQKFTYKDFPHFIQTWIWMTQFLREYEDFTLISEAVARDLAAQNIRYVEAFFSPNDFAHHGLTVQHIAAAIRAGLDRVPEVRIALIPDLTRDTGPDLGKAENVLNAAAEIRDLGVIGIGLGGSEQDFPAELFAPIYEKAHKLGLHTTAHAGEAAGPESVWAALDVLKVERIGHGVRSIEDPALVRELAKRRIPLEVCPISNMRTGIYSFIDEHPIRKLYERGVVVTVNTDDPKLFGNSLAEEYALLVSQMGFSQEEVKGLILQGIHSSWLSDSKKKALIQEFQSDPGW